MKERIASDKNKCYVVKSGRAQNSEARPWERGILMPSDKAEILRLFPQLTDEEQAVILDLIKSLLSGQESSVAAPVSIGR